jgi:hypothetical protein
MKQGLAPAVSRLPQEDQQQLDELFERARESSKKLTRNAAAQRSRSSQDNRKPERSLRRLGNTPKKDGRIGVQRTLTKQDTKQLPRRHSRVDAASPVSRTRSARTEEGYRVFSLEELATDQPEGLNGPCPFDCNCCFY